MSVRLDVFLYEKGFAPSRQKAKELVLEGHALVNGKLRTKPSYTVDDNDSVEIFGETLKYVGRGGLKLEKIVELCGIDLSGKTCMDIGASTGGFTDCMLQNGAETIYAVDVGSGQLAKKLCGDARVVNMEKTDIRNVKACDLSKLPEFISVDVSFISLKLILKRVFELLDENGTAAVLIKPQFEAGRENIGKNGIVRSKNVHISVVADILSFSERTGFKTIGICHSPITGSKGNIEYLVCLGKHGESVNADVKKIVDDAFEALH
ncbi:MAG: TlyA family RNA methyltransferase [Clostridium sp.]|nr:TlyA family RNA methyltransferase [Clostridium sp.]MCM1547364.1 TlyA family RNA methyltransferase [Ruminococcus sp.]